MSKVLLVEDDNNLREIYEARLQAEGYEIASAQDGEQALVVAKQFKPDLVISDVMMPKISGFEMLDILRNTEGLEKTRVIMLTALGQAEDQARADKLGADRYLVKSQVTLEDIVKSAHEILDGSEAAPAGEPASGEPTPAEQPTADNVPVAAEPIATPAATDIPVASEPGASVPVTPEPAAASAEPATPPTETVTAPTSDVPVQTEPAAAPTEPSSPSAAPSPTPPAASSGPIDVVNTPAQPAPSIPVASEPAADDTAAPTEPAVSEPTPSAAVTDTPASAAQPAITTPTSDTATPSVGSTPPTPREDSAAETTVEPAQASPATAPIAEPSTVTTEPAAAADGPGTTANEQQTVNQQIEDFITKAAAPTPSVEATDDGAADEQLLAEASQSLSDTDDTTTPGTVIAPPAPEAPATPEPAAPSPVNEEKPAPADDAVTIAHKKVIQPLESQPKPSLEDLLAREASKATATGQPTSLGPRPFDDIKPAPRPTTPPSSLAPAPNPAQSTGATQPGNDFDPNNIAL